MSDEPVALEDRIETVRLLVVESSFKRVPNGEEPETTAAIEVGGRVQIDEDKSVAIVTLKMSHKTRSATGVLATQLRYTWDEPSPSHNELIDFAEQYGVANAVPATAALFNEEFRRFGVGVSFPTPSLAKTVTEALIKDVRGRE